MPKAVKKLATVKDIKSFSKSTYVVTLVCDTNFPRFFPGQFLHLALDQYDPSEGYWPESRVFSIASMNKERNSIQIVYSVIGSFTKRMESELKLGLKVWLKLPYGDFIITNFISESDQIILIAGGTGISPFIPFLESINSANNVFLYYGVRNYNLLLFLDRLKHFHQSKKLRIKLFFEEYTTTHPDINFDFENGKLNIKKIFAEIEDKKNSVFCISGPPAMIFSFKKELLENGIKEKNILIDNWG